jgi:nucleoid-associated protein YgaU
MKLWHLALLSVVALAAAACENKQPQPTAHQDTTPPPTTEQKQPVTLDPYATDPYATDTTAQPHDAGNVQKAPARGKAGKDDTLIAGGRGSGKTYVVQQGDTLTSISKKVYGDSKRWKEIWNANKDVVPNKDKLKIGTKLTIP